jgi:hypothetical protein
MSRAEHFHREVMAHRHNHPYDPNDPYAIRPEGECEQCDKMREAIRDRMPKDPFEGLG